MYIQIQSLRQLRKVTDKEPMWLPRSTVFPGKFMPRGVRLDPNEKASNGYSPEPVGQPAE